MYMAEPVGEEVATPSLPIRTVLTVAMAITVVFGVLPAPLLSLAADALPF
jgi:NADH:ubiquinone oxidoreductase subunit 2 (subunit N)